MCRMYTRIGSKSVMTLAIDVLELGRVVYDIAATSPKYRICTRPRIGGESAML